MKQKKIKVWAVILNQKDDGSLGAEAGKKGIMECAGGMSIYSHKKDAESEAHNVWNVKVKTVPCEIILKLNNLAISKKMKKLKELTLPCQCAGGHITCGYLRVIKMDKDYEFCWVKNKDSKKAKIGIFLKEKTMGKLRKFLK